MIIKIILHGFRLHAHFCHLVLPYKMKIAYVVLRLGNWKPCSLESCFVFLHSCPLSYSSSSCPCSGYLRLQNLLYPMALILLLWASSLVRPLGITSMYTPRPEEWLKGNSMQEGAKLSEMHRMLSCMCVVWDRECEEVGSEPQDSAASYGLETPFELLSSALQMLVAG